MTACKTNNKTIKSTRNKEPAMLPEELLKLRKEMRLDKSSLAKILKTPYRTLQDYEAGKRGIAAAFADTMRQAHAENRPSWLPGCGCLTRIWTGCILVA